MEIIKTTTRTYKVQAVQRSFCKFDEQFRTARLRFHNDKSMCCFNCGYHFQEGDDIGVFVMKEGGNKLGCDSCALEALKEER